MSFVYTLISRNSNLILCEYTEYDGNLRDISKIILEKTSSNNKQCKIDYKTNFFYVDCDNFSDIRLLTFTTKDINEETAFSFLSDLKGKFLKKYNQQEIQSAFELSLNGFSKEIKKIVDYFQKNPQHSKTHQLKEVLLDTTDVMRENYEKLLERQEKISIVYEKADKLKSTSSDLRVSATSIKKKERRNCIILYVSIGVAAAVIIGIVLYLVLK
jgi:vesicle-associated membrane protein 7